MYILRLLLYNLPGVIIIIYTVKNFTIKYSLKDEPCLQDMIQSVKKAQNDIFAFLNVPQSLTNIEIVIYSDIHDFHNKVYGQLKEKWNVCAIKEHVIHAVSPLFPGEIHKYSDMLLILSKAVQDVILNNIFNGIPRWLGITILTSKLMTEQITYSKPQLSHFKEPNYHNDSESYFIANFILNKFGKNIVLELLNQPNDYNEILHLSDEEIDTELEEYYKRSD